MPSNCGGGSKSSPGPVQDGFITIYVATCQVAPFEIVQSVGAGSEQVTSASLSGPGFRTAKFPARVSPTAAVEAIQKFLVSQWMISKSPYLQLPAGEQFYTFKGRILRLDGSLDAYYLVDKDTIYLRFVSLGKICDPWAMSTSELRAELRARNAYEPRLQPEDLMTRLQDLLMKESRLQRLQQATRREELARVEAITKELHATAASKTRQLIASAASSWPRPSSVVWPHAPSSSRTVFLSITALERSYQAVPRDVLDPAIFVFDTERKWVFDAHTSLQRAHFDYRYMSFDSDFLEMLTLKEEAGLVFWFRPAKSYDKLSAFLETLEDPATRRKYSPLMLKDAKWLTLCGENGWEGKPRRDGRKRDATKVPRYTSSIARVVSNLRSGSFDYLAVQELLHQSNPTLLFAPI